MQLATWSTPDQTVWSQYFNQAVPRCAGSSALSVGPYGEVGERVDHTMWSKQATPQKDSRTAPYTRQPPSCIMCCEAYDQCACWQGTIEELVAYESAEEGRSDQQLYTYTSDLQALEACTSDTKSTLPVSATAITTPLQGDRWEDALSNHPDRVFSNYISTGIRCGFRVGFDRRKTMPASTTRNMPSTRHNPQPVREYLATELKAKRIIGVGDEVQGLVVSRFGLIPKKDQKDKWQLIQNLPHPKGRSINDGIDRDLCSLTYVTVDRAVEQIIKLGRGT